MSEFIPGLKRDARCLALVFGMAEDVAHEYAEALATLIAGEYGGDRVRIERGPYIQARQAAIYVRFRVKQAAGLTANRAAQEAGREMGCHWTHVFRIARKFASTTATGRDAQGRFMRSGTE